MPGRIKELIDLIIDTRANGNETIENCTRTKLILKGVIPEMYGVDSEDDPEVIAKLMAVAEEYGIDV